MKHAVRNLALTALAAGVMFAAPRAEAQVSVDVDIDIGSITILYYYSDIDVTVSATELLDALDVANDEVDTGEATLTGTSPAAGEIDTDDGDINNDADVTALVTDIELNLQNVWAVRAIGAAGSNTTVTVAQGAATTITTAGGSTITVDSVSIDDTTDACATAATTAVFTPPGLGTPTQGSVCLQLDFSAVDESGNHDGGADTGDAVYTLSASTT